jgi:hypothetical protein
MLEPGHRQIPGTLLQNGNYLGDGVALLNPDGKGSFQMTSEPQPLQPNAAHTLRDVGGHYWPLDSVSQSTNADASHYELTHSIEFAEIAIEP